MSGPKTIALVDYMLEGHHAGWLLYFAETLLRLGHRVVCICPDPAWAGQKIRERLPELADAFSSHGISKPSFPCIPTRRARLFIEALAIWRRAAAAIAKHLTEPPDLVFFAMLDGLLIAGLAPILLDAIFPYHWTGIYFHPHAERLQPRHHRRPAFLRSDYCLRTPNCKGIAVLDEGIAETLQRAVAPTRVLVFPDFTIPAPVTNENPVWIQELRQRAGKRTLVGCLGALNHRKGIFTLLRIALEKNSSGFFFVFAGPFSGDDLYPEDQLLWDKAVATPPENCAFRLEKISDVEFDSLAANCDVIYAAYRRFPHSSNLLGKAAQFSKPVIVSKGYCMEERVRRFSLGRVVHEDDSADSLAALLTLQTQINAPDYQPGAGFAGYLEEHSTLRLRQGLEQLIQL